MSRWCACHSMIPKGMCTKANMPRGIACMVHEPLRRRRATIQDTQNIYSPTLSPPPFNTIRFGDDLATRQQLSHAHRCAHKSWSFDKQRRAATSIVQKHLASLMRLHVDRYTLPAAFEACKSCLISSMPAEKTLTCEGWWTNKTQTLG